MYYYKLTLLTRKMMIRKLKIILPLLFFVTIFTSYQTVANEEPDPKDKVLLTILKYVLTQGHYEPKQIDDTFSENVFNAFIDNLDASKRYFLQSDINEFNAYKFEIDDQINNEDLSFFYLVYDRLMLRTNESQQYYKEILKSEFDFTKNDTLNAETDHLPYANSKEELIQNWHKQLKFSTLSRLYDKINDEADKKKKMKTIK